MAGSHAIPEPEFKPDALPYGVVAVDCDGTIRSYEPFAAAHPGYDGLVGRNFFTDVAPNAKLRRFHERFAAFSARSRTAIEPFEFVFANGPQERHVTMLFVRDATAGERVSIILMQDGALA